MKENEWLDWFYSQSIDNQKIISRMVREFIKMGLRTRVACETIKSLMDAIPKK